MRGLAVGRPVPARVSRRWTLGALAALSVGCAAPAGPSIGGVGDVYVALARARAIAVLDPATDREVARISLAPLGAASHPWRLGVSPTGGAAVMPLKSGTSIGLVSPGERAGSKTVVKAARGPRRCELVRVDGGRRSAYAGSTPETAQALTADAAGRAYVVMGDGSAVGPSFAAVVDLESGTVLRHLPLATSGESVLAVQAARDGHRLFASIWRWDDGPASHAAHGASSGVGRILAVDTQSGRTAAQWVLPAFAAATDLALAAGPDGRPGAVYVSVVTPGPTRDDDDSWYSYPSRNELAALDPARLGTLARWPLPHRPNAMVVTPDGARAYLLSGSFTGQPWSVRLTSFDLAVGAPSVAWPLPPGCLSLALAPSGKLYVADVMDDRLWRVDTRRDAFLGSVPQPGAPMAVAARE